MKTIRNVFWVIALALLGWGSVNAQLWQGVGGGTNGPVTCLSHDEANGLLYVAGSFDYAGDSLVCQIAAWDGINWSKLGAGTGDTSCTTAGCQTIESVVLREGELFVGGRYGMMAGNRYWPYLNSWNGSNWTNYGPINGPVTLELLNNQLFAFGMFDSIYGQFCGRILKWNDSTWTSFGGNLPFSQAEHFYCAEYYSNRYYFGGNFEASNQMNEIVAWGSNGWEDVAGGIKGDSWVRKLKTFKNLLFVGGYFFQQDGNSADYLMTWDDVQWANPFPNVNFLGQIEDLEVIDDRLFIVGTHLIFDGSNWNGPYKLAHFDGLNFCSFGGPDLFLDNVTCLESFNSEFYISSDRIIGGDSVNYIAKWIGGDSTDICISQPVRIQDPAWTQNPSISLYPSPTKSAFTLTLPANTSTCTFKIHDITGREVAPARTYRAGDPPVDVTHLSAGLYFVEVQVKDWVEVVKLVKE